MKAEEEAEDLVLGLALGSTWTPKVGKMMAFMAIISLGILFYILLVFR